MRYPVDQEAGELARHGAYCSLRPLQQADYGWLYALFSNEQNLVRWRPRGATPSPENFVRFIWESVLVQFVIEDQNHRPAGLITAYQVSGLNRTVYFAVIIDESSRGSGTAMEACALFLAFLLAT